MRTIHWIMAATLITAASAQAETAPGSESVFAGEETIVTLVSQDPLPSEEVAEQVFDDTVVTANVVAALVTDDELQALNLNVETQEGVVSLSGRAASEAERQRAVELASAIDGVCGVKDSIELQR